MIIVSASSIISVFIGILVGNYISEGKEKKRLTSEIEKTRILVNSDFSTAKKMAKSRVKRIDEHFDVIKKILDEEPLPDENPEKFSSDPDVYFPFWETLIHSGALLKLEPIEIKQITSIHDYVIKMLKNHQVIFETHIENKKDPTYNEDVSKDVEYMSKLRQFYRGVLGALEIIKIDWITFEDTVIMKFIDEEEKYDEIFVKNGITYYPNGIKVDSHGTIL